MRVLSWMVAGVLAASTAWAGSGPWVLSQGDQQLYLGVEAQRFGHLAQGAGSFTDSVVAVDQGISSLAGKAILAYGLAPRFELEVEVPVVVSFANRIGDACTGLGPDACRRTEGLGIIVARGKVLLVDEVAGAPLSLSLGLDARFGHGTYATRGRITNIGEGTLDLEPRVALGRSGGLGGKGGYYSVYADLGWRYRFPIDRDYGADSLAIPGWEITSSGEVLFTPTGPVSFGPSYVFYTRPNGVDFEDLDPNDPNRFAALRSTSASLGGKALIRNSKNITFSVGIFHTLYAVNNPTDTLSFGAGVAFRDLFRKSGT